MADNPLRTAFDQKIVPDPSGTFASSTGGFDPGNNAPTGSPLTNSPFDNKICPDRSDIKETANSLSGLPLQNTKYSVGEEEPTNAPDISTGQIPVAGLGKK
ncbi:MAG TPA: hypothetical protein VFE84_05020 [Patescibacteria group bacterium]|nr:hypothetical protein [Patescibacteria group bacterium]